MMAYGFDFGSAAESRLVFSGLRTRPSDWNDLRDEVERVLDVGARLQDPAGAPQQRLEPTQFARLGIRRRQGARSAHLTVKFVEKQLLRGHSDEAGP